MNVPNHVAIIMDGNGRWAKKKGFIRSIGHKEGSVTAIELAKHIINKGTKYLSFYTFSCDNFKRSEEEVSFLFKLLVDTFDERKQELMDENIKVVISGVKDNLSEHFIKKLEEIEKLTCNNTKGVINLCINYSSRLEILDAFRKMKNLKLDNLEPNDIRKYMYNDLPDIDLLIRTSGEKRLSDFMLFQASYAELYFTDVLFPDFDAIEYDKALDEFNSRDRRFGGIKDENKNN